MNAKTKLQIQSLVQKEVSRLLGLYMRPQVGMHILPGGKKPKRESHGAIAYDVRLRAIVDPFSMDPENRHLRRTLFDFRNIIDPTISEFAVQRKCEEKWRGKRWVFRLEPGAMVLCGIGFVTEMPFPLCYLTLCRSGIASKHKVIVANGPGTVDPDYRGEAGIILFNCGKSSFYLYQGMRIAQVKFEYAVIPELKNIQHYRDMSTTPRAAGGFGSTGFC